MFKPEKNKEQLFQITETDWQNLEEEIDRQRPSKGEKKNIDWWHFTAYIHNLSIISLEERTSLLNEDDKKNILNDFQIKLAEDTEEEKWRNAALYSARIKDLGIDIPSFSKNDWQNFKKQTEKFRAQNEHWHVIYYLSHLKKLDPEKANELITESDWDKIEETIQETQNYPAASYLALNLLNNLYELDPKKTEPFFNEEYITKAKEKIQNLKKQNEWFKISQYAKEIIRAQKIINELK